MTESDPFGRTEDKDQRGRFPGTDAGKIWGRLFFSHMFDHMRMEACRESTLDLAPSDTSS